jgi:type IV pilus assembly protein PilF
LCSGVDQEGLHGVFKNRPIPYLLISILLLSGCATGKPKMSPAEKARSYLEAAAAAKSEGDATGALQYLAQAEQSDDSMPELYHLRALALNMKQERKLAIASVRQALSLNPKYSDAMNTLGRFLMDEGDSKSLAEAQKWLQTAAADLLYRDSWKPRTNLGIIHYRRGEDAKAGEQLTKAVEASPAQSCIAHYYLGHIRLKAGAFLDAARSYDRATQKFCAGFADAHLAEGVALERGREFDRARKKFIEVTRSFPNSTVADQAVNRLKGLP